RLAENVARDIDKAKGVHHRNTPPAHHMNTGSPAGTKNPREGQLKEAADAPTAEPTHEKPAEQAKAPTPPGGRVAKQDEAPVPPPRRSYGETSSLTPDELDAQAAALSKVNPAYNPLAKSALERAIVKARYGDAPVTETLQRR